MSQERMQFTLPRQIVKWLDSLDLSYEVRNPRKDLATGFVVAQILTRYFPKEITIYSFHNSQSKQKRHNNWQQIQKFLKTKDFKIETDEFIAISNLAPKIAYNFSIRFYQFLTKKKFVPRPAQQQQNSNIPGYKRPTAASLTKDREIQRIVDNQKKKNTINMTLTAHYNKTKQDKYNSGLVQWLINKRKRTIENQVRAREQQLSRKTRTNNVQNVSQVKQIQLKCFNSSTSKKAKNELGETMQNKGVVDFLQQSCLGILKKQPISRQIKKLGIELKQKQGMMKNILVELFRNCGKKDQNGQKKVKHKSLKVLINQFMQMSQINLIVDNVQNNYVDFKKFFLMIFQPIHTLKSTSKTLSLMLQLTREICDRLIQSQPQSTRLTFQSILLPTLLSYYVQDFTKKNLICLLSFCFLGDNQQYLLILLKKIKRSLNSNQKYLDLQIQFLDIMTQKQAKTLIQPLFKQYYLHALNAIKDRSPHLRTKGLKILNDLVVFDAKPVVQRSQQIFKLANDDWWQVKAQMLILTTKLLLFGKGVDKDALQIILSLFIPQNSHNILRIGIIKIAQLLFIKPQLCDRYLQILIQINSQVRKDMLDTGSIRYGPIVLGSNTFIYQLTGAPLMWNSIGISKAMHKYCINHRLESFSKKHLDILFACLHQELRLQDKQHWIQIFQNLKSYLFQAFLNDQLCKINSQILKKLFVFQEIQDQLIKSSQKHFLQLFTKIFNPQISDQCKNNLLSMLIFLNDHKQIFKQYSYKLIKQFSQKHKNQFLQSNLVNFMNQLAKQRRNNQFQ